MKLTLKINGFNEWTRFEYVSQKGNLCDYVGFSHTYTDDEPEWVQFDTETKSLLLLRGERKRVVRHLPIDARMATLYLANGETFECEMRHCVDSILEIEAARRVGSSSIEETAKVAREFGLIDAERRAYKALEAFWLQKARMHKKAAKAFEDEKRYRQERENAFIKKAEAYEASIV